MLKFYLFMLVISIICGGTTYLYLEAKLNKSIKIKANIIIILLTSIFIIPNILAFFSFIFNHDAFMEGVKEGLEK